MCRSTSVAPLTPTYHVRSPTGDKPWYLHRGKLTAKPHHAFHLGLTNEGREAAKQFAERNDDAARQRHSFPKPRAVVDDVVPCSAPHDQAVGEAHARCR